MFGGRSWFDDDLEMGGWVDGPKGGMPCRERKFNNVGARRRGMGLFGGGREEFVWYGGGEGGGCSTLQGRLFSLLIFKGRVETSYMYVLMYSGLC